MPVNFIKI